VGEDPTEVFGALVPVIAGSPGAASLDMNTFNLLGISCSSTTACLASGTNNSSTGVAVPITLPVSGTSFGSNEVAAGTSELYAIACGSATFCLAGGPGSSAGAVVTITGGTLGSTVPIPGSSGFFGAACPTPSFCGADGFSSEGVVVGDNNGTIRHGVVTGTTDLRGGACPSDTECLGVGAAGSTGVLQVFPDTWPLPGSAAS
jgi:hypothetical protein